MARYLWTLGKGEDLRTLEFALERFLWRARIQIGARLEVATLARLKARLKTARFRAYP